MGWFSIPNMMGKSFKIPWFQSPPTSWTLLFQLLTIINHRLTIIYHSKTLKQQLQFGAGLRCNRRSLDRWAARAGIRKGITPHERPKTRCKTPPGGGGWKTGHDFFKMAVGVFRKVWFPWDFYEILMGLLWDFYGIFMGILWDFYGNLMGLKPCTPGNHRNSWDLRMFIPLKMVLI